MRIAFALLLVGCAEGDFTPKPGQERAIQLVWHGLFGRSEVPPPIEWVHAPDVDGYRGRTWPAWKIQVADGTFGDDLQPICLTSFAHELMHYSEWLRTGDADPLHFRGNWNLVDYDAYLLLAENGL
jgi:hypothetical protein